jgi:hypothetical protein
LIVYSKMTKVTKRPGHQPEQRPWRTKADAEGWEVVCRGRGQRRLVRSHLLVEFTREQDAWLAKSAAAAGITTAELLRRLVDQAREAELDRRPSGGGSVDAGALVRKACE